MVDGYLNFDTKVDTSGFDKGVKSISKTSSKLKGAFSNIMQIGAGNIIANVAIKAVEGLVKVSAAAVEAASDLQEVQNVVDTAFGEMAYKAEQFAETSIKDFGMSRLAAKRTSSTYMSMAKSMGLPMEAASDMSIELTKLTGDVASFYNISQDLASVKLKSVFTGETETLKDLGVVMTEVNLKEFAHSQGITKSYNAMTQAEKVALRYQFVTSALGDAQGDFAKTSGSWANQTRILKEQWRELLGILGGGIIRILTPVLQVINSIISGLINLANAFAATVGKLFGFGKQMKATVKSTTTAAGAQQELAENTEAAGAAASTALAAFDKLDVLQQNQGAGGGGAEAVGGEIEIAETPINDNSEVLDKISARLQKLQPYVDRLREAWERLKDAFDRFMSSPGVRRVLEFLRELGAELLERGWAGGLSIWAGLLDVLAGALDVVAGSLTWLVGILTGDMAMAGDGFEQMLSGLSGAVTGLGEILEGVFIWILGVDCVNAIKKYLSLAWEWFSNTKLYTTGIQTVLDGLITFLTGVFTLDWKKAWKGVQNIFRGVWNSIISIVESAINLVIKAVNWCINQLNKIHIDVPEWVTELTGMTGFGFNIPNLSEVTLKRLPKLASGAIIPPNGEFLAMLGDQKSGNNLEAPEGLIRQIVREESGGGDIVINAKGTMGQLIRLLKLEIDRENTRAGGSFVKGGVY